ncbi:RagB/SusD family nutrient uptake outer membrane protein [Parapedobacter koreensis]|uniref:SusD family protein n=1 Tax=Parapedobacter koreensis TaxID=332977 RepID=A0A1H7TBD8_9SPHI|nr:RagB/SusD family nutrient uptake outer membrane protein [Parapedobacter koreensis]SEL81714.1 SusD family protein [Parapedobacter koreensis]
MMKKSIYIGVLALALTTVATSCSDEYLETTPTHQVSTASAFATVDNAWAALNGIHRTLYTRVLGQQQQGGQSGNMLQMDVLGEDLVFVTSASQWLLAEYQWLGHINPTHRSVEYNYQFYYIIIGNVNMILANIDGAAGSEADKNYIKGQAFAYRAWSYYQMVQLFGERYVGGSANNGLGVSLVLTPGLEAIPRNTVEEVYTQINADLDQAISLLEGYDRGTDKSQLNSNVAKGLKARVALTQQNYPVAATYAREARAGFPLMSAAEYLSGFNNYSVGEWMWGSRMTADQVDTWASFFAHMSINFSSTIIRTSPKVMYSVLYDQISDTDIRKQLWDPTGANVTDFPLPLPTFTRHPYLSRKFSVVNESSSMGDVPYMRAAEMYLIEAEALARSGNEQAADVLYEYAVVRDPAYTRSTNTGQALVDEILIQRRSELWGEGFRFYDLKRTNTPLVRAGNHSATYAVTINVPTGDIRWQFLIPQDEINNSNGVVTQNPQ